MIDNLSTLYILTWFKHQTDLVGGKKDNEYLLKNWSEQQNVMINEEFSRIIFRSDGPVINFSPI